MIKIYRGGGKGDIKGLDISYKKEERQRVEKGGGGDEEEKA